MSRRSGIFSGGSTVCITPLVVERRGHNKWPTPGAQDYKWRTTPFSAARRRDIGKQLSLHDKVVLEEGLTVSEGLNPVWVEWLMGFPPGWTI